MEVTPGFEPGNQSFADSCLTTWLCHHWRHLYYMRTFEKSPHLFLFLMPTLLCGHQTGAGNEARTRYLHLGKVALYQMSYARRWCPEPESNQRHVDFQSTALPTELSGQVFWPANRRGRGITTPKGTHETEIPSRGRWRPGTGSNRRPLA